MLIQLIKSTHVHILYIHKQVYFKQAPLTVFVDCSRLLLIIIYSSYQSSLNHLWKSGLHSYLIPLTLTCSEQHIRPYLNIHLYFPFNIRSVWNNAHLNKSFFFSFLFTFYFEPQTKGLLFCYSRLSSAVSSQIAVNHKSDNRQQLQRIRWNKNRHWRTRGQET